MKRRRGSSESGDDRITRADVTRLLGLGATLVAALMLTFTPQLAYRARHKEGYRLVDAVQASDSSTGRNVRIRLLTAGEELLVRRSTVDGGVPTIPFKVWYNGDARLNVGIVLFDERVLDPRSHPHLTSVSQALAAIALNIVLAVLGLRAVFRAS